jgi:sortase A
MSHYPRTVPDTTSPNTPFWSVALGIIGKAMITIGLLMLGFVVYQLWGTGIKTEQAQRELAKEYEQLTLSDASSSTSNGQSGSLLPGPIDRGDVIGRIVMPKIDVDKWVVAGATMDQLERGPGLFANTSLPGQLGNSAIAGHRTSYGAPFSRIDQLDPGDDITIVTPRGSFTYAVTETKIVPATAVEVLDTIDADKATLTLVSCHPKWTSRDRIVVFADLISSGNAEISEATPLATGDTTAELESFESGWFADKGAIPHTLLWALVLAAIWILAVLLVRREKFKWFVAYPVATVPFVLALYFFYVNLSRLLPPGV